jgi:hypothetical protein
VRDCRLRCEQNPTSGNSGAREEFTCAFIFISEVFAMRAASAPTTIRVYEPIPLGDVSLAPRELTGVSQAELARSMAAYLMASAPDSDAQALSSLRRAFPRAPLTARVAALAALIRR